MSYYYDLFEFSVFEILLSLSITGIAVIRIIHPETKILFIRDCRIRKKRKKKKKSVLNESRVVLSIRFVSKA